MKKIALVFISLISGMAILYSCTKTTGEAPGATNCVTTNMKYSTDLTAILQANCYSCHSGAVVNAGINLSTYAGVKAVADNGKLVGVISHAAGFKPMPDGGVKLSDCTINKIKSWVNAGALNN
jgi:hypothetical protein